MGNASNLVDIFPFDMEYVWCECGHYDGAHKDKTGECKEEDCKCKRFRQSEYDKWTKKNPGVCPCQAPYNLRIVK